MNVTRTLYLLSKYIKMDDIQGSDQVAVEVLLIFLTFIIPLFFLVNLTKCKKQAIILFSGIWLCTAGCFMNTYIKHAQYIIKQAEQEKTAGLGNNGKILQEGGKEAIKLLENLRGNFREGSTEWNKITKSIEKLRNPDGTLKPNGKLNAGEISRYNEYLRNQRIQKTKEVTKKNRKLKEQGKPIEYVRVAPARPDRRLSGDAVFDTLTDTWMHDHHVWLGEDAKRAYEAGELELDGFTLVPENGEYYIKANPGRDTSKPLVLRDKKTGRSINVKTKEEITSSTEPTPSAEAAPAKESPKPEDKAVDPNDKTTWKRNPKNPNEIINPLTEKYKDLLALRDRAAKARTAVQDVTGIGRIDLSAEDLNLLRENYKNPEIKSAVDDIIKYHKDTYLNSDLQGYLDGNRTVFRNPSDGKVVFDNTWSPEEIADWIKNHPEDAPKGYAPPKNNITQKTQLNDTSFSKTPVETAPKRPAAKTEVPEPVAEPIAPKGPRPEATKLPVVKPTGPKTPPPKVETGGVEQVSPEQLKEDLAIPPKKEMPEPRVSLQEKLNDQLLKDQQKKVDELRAQPEIVETDPFAELAVNENVAPRGDVHHKNNVEHPPKNKTLLNRISSLFTPPFKRKTLNLGENVDSLRTPEEFVDYISKIDTGNPDKAIDDLYAIRRRFSNSPEYYEINDSPLNFLSKDYFTTPELDPIRDALRNIEQKLGVHYDGAYFEGGKHIQSKNLPNNVIEELKRIKKIKGSPEEVATQLNALSQKYRSSNAPDDLVVLNAISEKGLKLGFDIDPETVLFTTQKSVDPAVEAFNKMLKNTGEQEVPSPISKAEQIADATRPQNGADAGPSDATTPESSVKGPQSSSGPETTSKSKGYTTAKDLLGRTWVNSQEASDAGIKTHSLLENILTGIKTRIRDAGADVRGRVEAFGKKMLKPKRNQVDSKSTEKLKADTGIPEPAVDATQAATETATHFSIPPTAEIMDKPELPWQEIQKGIKWVGDQIPRMTKSFLEKVPAEAKRLYSSTETQTPIQKYLLWRSLNKLKKLRTTVRNSTLEELAQKEVPQYHLNPELPIGVKESYIGANGETRIPIAPELAQGIQDGHFRVIGEDGKPITYGLDTNKITGSSELYAKGPITLEDLRVTGKPSAASGDSGVGTGTARPTFTFETPEAPMPDFVASKAKGGTTNGLGIGGYAKSVAKGAVKGLDLGAGGWAPGARDTGNALNLLFGRTLGLAGNAYALNEGLNYFSNGQPVKLWDTIINLATKKDPNNLPPIPGVVTEEPDGSIVNHAGNGSVHTPQENGTIRAQYPQSNGNTNELEYSPNTGSVSASRAVNKDGVTTTESIFNPEGELTRRETLKPDSSITVEAKDPENPSGSLKVTNKPAPKPKTFGDWMTDNVVPEYFSKPDNFGSYGHSLFGALAGSALGAGIGGLNYILTDENELSEEEKKKRSLARAMLSSAGIGAGIGGLVGGASDYTRA